jgi:hypothetical protein
MVNGKQAKEKKAQRIHCSTFLESSLSRYPASYQVLV